MRIYIPTLDRAWQQRTWYRLTPRCKEITSLVIQEHEREIFSDWPNILVCPEKGITNVRKWIIDYHHHRDRDKRLIMFDDDIDPLIRSGTGKEKKDKVLRLPTPEETDTLVFDLLFGALQEYAHIGLSPREGQAFWENQWQENSRCIRVLGFRTDVILKHVAFGRVEVMEDFDITLQLLRRGYKNIVNCFYAQGQGQTQASGGCSGYRTHEVQDRSARKLAELHSPFVQVKEKINKTGGEFGKRTDVQIFWKAAYAEGQRKHGHQVIEPCKP